MRSSALFAVAFAISAWAAPAGTLNKREMGLKGAIAYPDSYKRGAKEEAIAYPDSYKRDAKEEAIAYPDPYKRDAKEEAIAYPDSY